jgi:hypothetical protein
MKNLILYSAILVLAIAACEKNNPQALKDAAISIKSTEYGGCFYNSVGTAKSEEWPVDSLYYVVDSSGLKVYINKIENCCAVLKDSYKTEGDTLKIFIHDEGENPCRCLCQFDLIYSVEYNMFETTFIKVYYKGYGVENYSLWKETYFCGGLEL